MSQELHNNELLWREIIEEVESPDKDKSSILLIIPCEKTFNLALAEKVAKDLANNFRVLVYNAALPNSLEVDSFSERVNTSLQNNKIKRVTIFAAGSASNLAIALSINFLGLARRVAFLDPELRMNSSLTERIIDKIESLLPLGLPLRPLNNHYDPRPALHRLRCPVYLVSSEKISLRSSSELSFMQKRIPNSIKKEIDYESKTLSEDIKNLLTALILQPVKRPQKNLAP